MHRRLSGCEVERTAHHRLTLCLDQADGYPLCAVHAGRSWRWVCEATEKSAESGRVVPIAEC